MNCVWVMVMNIGKYIQYGKSRRDNILLTVGEAKRNLRKLNLYTFPSPAGTTHCCRSIALAGLMVILAFVSVGYASLHLRLIKFCPCGTGLPDPCYPLSIHRLLLEKRSGCFRKKIGIFWRKDRDVFGKRSGSFWSVFNSLIVKSEFNITMQWKRPV
jgi:hypothetical protein